MFCGRSSSGRARPCQGRGSEFEPRRPLQKETPSDRVVFFCIYRLGRGSNRARAKREKHAGGMFWCPRACGGPAGPPASLVTFFAFAVCGDADNKSSGQSQRNTIPIGWCFLHLPGRRRCAHRHAGSTKASYFYDAFVLLGRWSKGTLFHYLLYFFLLTTVVPMAAPPLTSSRAIHKAELLVSPVWGDLGSSFSFAVTVSAFLISFVPSLSL